MGSAPLDRLAGMLQRGSPLYVNKDKRLKRINLKEKLHRFLNPAHAASQDIKVTALIIKKLENVKTHRDLKKISSGKISRFEDSQFLRSCEIYYKKVLRRRCIKTEKIKTAGQELNFELQVHRLALALNLPQKILRAHPDFVKFAIANHFHHRIDKFYQEHDLGVRYNKKKHVFELPIKNRDTTHKWVSWKKFPVTEKGKIIGYDLLAYGFEKHSNATWKKLKPFKLIPADETPYGNENHYVELVTTYPTYKSGPGQFGHVYLNFYVPNKEGDVKVYSVGYDLTDLSVPDVLEFFERKRVTSARAITRQQWHEIKAFIEEVQKTHIKKRRHLHYQNPDHKVEKFYLRHMRKNCGNFAVALFEDLTGIKNLFTRFRVMAVLFPKQIHHVLDWIEDRLPHCMRYAIQKINIVTRGVIPSKLIPKQIKLGEFHLVEPHHLQMA